MNDDSDLGELFEELALNKIYADPESPIFQNFGGKPKWWNPYQGPYPVSTWSRRNTENYKDIIYLNNNGKRHRIYGPAYISKLYNIQIWYKDGVMHREDGPAYIHNHNMVWFYEGKLHRLDGPAVITGGGPKQYWIHGMGYSLKEYKKEIQRQKRRGLIK